MRLVSSSLCCALQKEEFYFISVNCYTEQVMTYQKMSPMTHDIYLLKIHCCFKLYTTDKLETFKIVLIKSNGQFSFQQAYWYQFPQKAKVQEGP